MVEHDDPQEILPISKLTERAFFPCTLHGGRKDYLTIWKPPTWWKVYIPTYVQYAMEDVERRDLMRLQRKLQMHRDPTDYKFLSSKELSQYAHAMVEARKMRWKRIETLKAVKIHEKALREA